MVVDNLTRTFQNEPVKEWARVLDHEDYPRDYYASFAAITTNFIAFTMPNYVTKPFMTILAEVLLRNFPAEKSWLLNDYMPEILKAVENNKIPVKERLKLILKFTGVVVKLVYAFLYQEEHIPVPGFLILIVMLMIFTYSINFSRMKRSRQ